MRPPSKMLIKSKLEEKTILDEVTAPRVKM